MDYKYLEFTHTNNSTFLTYIEDARISLFNRWKLNNKEKVLWRICEHEWERDWNAAFDDHIKHFCKKCSLWRNKYMYQ